MDIYKCPFSKNFTLLKTEILTLYILLKGLKEL